MPAETKPSHVKSTLGATVRVRARVRVRVSVRVRVRVKVRVRVRVRVRFRVRVRVRVRISRAGVGLTGGLRYVWLRRRVRARGSAWDGRHLRLTVFGRHSERGQPALRREIQIGLELREQPPIRVRVRIQIDLELREQPRRGGSGG